MSFIARRAFTTTTRRLSAETALKKDTKRNPELFVLGGIMVAVLGGAGYYFGQSPTQSTSENAVAKAGMPWETNAGEGKYRYFPGGNENAEPKDAPSAVNVVVVPNVSLPTELHEKYNKWGKDGY